MTNKSAGKLIFQALLLLILLFGLVRLVMVKSGAVLVIESLVLVLLLLLTVGGLATYRRSGSKVLFVIFLFYILNLLFLWYYYKSLYLILFLASLIGFWVSLPSSSKGKKIVEEPVKSSAPPQKIVDGKVVEAKADPEAKAEPKEKPVPASVKATFTPGKYIASKRSNVYHEPKCEWAKKIQKARRVWFASREEALNKGYKKHDCVK